jgi:hypothetical protein
VKKELKYDNDNDMTCISHKKTDRSSTHNNIVVECDRPHIDEYDKYGN